MLEEKDGKLQDPVGKEDLKVEKQTDQTLNTQKKIQIENNPKCLLILNKEKKISRNDRCEATGKKFKNCCGAL